MSSYYRRIHAPTVPVLCERCRTEVAARRPLTKRQAAIMAFLREFHAGHQYMPSFEEIAEHFLYSSLGTVHEHLRALEMRGWIARGFNESRAIVLLGGAQ